MSQLSCIFFGGGGGESFLTLEVFIFIFIRTSQQDDVLKIYFIKHPMVKIIFLRMREYFSLDFLAP